MSSLLQVGTVGAGVFSLGLGIVHIWVPSMFAYRTAIGTDGFGLPLLGPMRLGAWSYERRRSDLVGLTWVMSNAASYVLMSIGVVDLAWALGDRTIPLAAGALWTAGWWGLRAAGQLAVGRRRVDVGLVMLFVSLASWHCALVAVNPAASR